ncbi:MAG: helix-turn-helix domain-containing protein [Nevskia sp.]|jgi:transcriptional regulator with XRE-family HTH domain|nr:helix-turn-helix domain-containing protein [Nevskia sp.]
MPNNIDLSIRSVNRTLYLNANRFAYSFEPMKYGERLRLAREKAELTQQELAERVGMKQPSLAYLENPAKNAKGSEFTVKLSRVLGVSVDWLDDEIGEMTPTLYSTSNPTLVEILQALEPRAEYGTAPLSKDDEQILGVADYLPPDKLDGMIKRIEEEGGSKLALLARLRAIQRDGEANEPTPEPPQPKAPPVHARKGKPYKLPEPGIATPAAGHHKKRVA